MIAHKTRQSTGPQCRADTVNKLIGRLIINTTFLATILLPLNLEHYTVAIILFKNQLLYYKVSKNSTIRFSNIIVNKLEYSSLDNYYIREDHHFKTD